MKFYYLSVENPNYPQPFHYKYKQSAVNALWGYFLNMAGTDYTTEELDAYHYFLIHCDYIPGVGRVYETEFCDMEDDDIERRV